MAKYWKPSKARVQRDITEAQKQVEALTFELNRVIGFDKPSEYREQVISAALLMVQSHDALASANLWKPLPDKPWDSENALRNYKSDKQASEDLHAKYAEAKSRIIAEWQYANETVTEHIKAAYRAVI